MDKSIEAAARAIFGEGDWDSLPDEIKANYRKAACLAIAAYRDAEIADLRAKLEAAERDADIGRRYRSLKKGPPSSTAEFVDLGYADGWAELDRLCDEAARGGELG